MASRSFENLLDRHAELAPCLSLEFQLSHARLGQLVVLGATIIVRYPPSCLDPATPLETMQGRIERALLDAQHIARNLLHTFGNSPSVLSTGQQSAQNQEVQCPLGQFDSLGQFRPLSLRQKNRSGVVEVQGESAQSPECFLE